MATREIYRGRVIRLSLDEVDLPNGTHCELEVVHHPGGSAVVALNAQGEVCLLEQYRYVAGGWVWELPAGKHEVGNSPEVTARCELQEEAGVQAKEWHALGRVLSSPGVFAEVIHLYLATALSPVASAHESEEVIRVHWQPLEEACERALKGEFTDAKTIIGLLRARDYLQFTP
ncbi:MAG: NUDIX hydrolase [Gammaproteobacteria bacterium]